MTKIGKITSSHNGYINVKWDYKPFNWTWSGVYTKDSLKNAGLVIKKKYVYKEF